MNTLADALIELIVYTDLAGKAADGSSRDTDRDDDDATALEGVFYILGSASLNELAALRAAVERAIAQEELQPEPSQARLACYQGALESFDHLSPDDPETA